MERLFKVGDRVVAKGYAKVVFEIRGVIESLAKPYEVYPLFVKRPHLVWANEDDMRIATEAELADAVTRLITR